MCSISVTVNRVSVKPIFMKPGRPPKSGGEYANSKAVESAMLLLLKESKEWVTSREVIDAMDRNGTPNARIVWNRGKTRMIEDHGRLEVKPELDKRHRAIEKYRLRFVEGKTLSISIEAYDRLPPDLKKFYRARESDQTVSTRRSFEQGLGGLFAGLSKASLQTIETGWIEEEILRRERQNPDELVSRFAREFGEVDEQMEHLRPVSSKLLQELLRARKGNPSRRAIPPSEAGKLGPSRGASESPSIRSEKRRTASRRPAALEPGR
jgi:hypothetical protein